MCSITMSCRCYYREVVEDGSDEFGPDVKLERYWQIELMDGREVGSLCQQLSIISHSPGA